MCAEAERLLPKAFARLDQGNPWGLSRREEELMLCLCRKLADKEVAAALGISDETVHVHLRHAFKKLGVHDRQSAIQEFTKK
jgi:DNA-binding CsgD family transcriptional regulator